MHGKGLDFRAYFAKQYLYRQICHHEWNGFWPGNKSQTRWGQGLDKIINMSFDFLFLIVIGKGNPSIPPIISFCIDGSGRRKETKRLEPIEPIISSQLIPQ